LTGSNAGPDGFVLQGDPPITVDIRASKSTKRLSLRVSRLDGRITLSKPARVRPSEAMDFALEKETWIRKQLAGQIETIIPSHGGHVLFTGHDAPIVKTSSGPVRYEDGQFFVPGDSTRVPARLAAFLKTTARTRLAVASDAYARELVTKYQRISLRDTRSRWGSCTSSGNLMYSWRLIMAPSDVLDYVAAHEVAHLLEMNHSAAYWANVARIFPDYETPRRWLWENAARLHSYHFRN
jgi:predicted metal-dependent hydrolase